MLNLRSQNRLRILAIVLMAATALNALAAGYSFITDPSGSGIGINTDYIDRSPFVNFLVPGILLFVFNGLLNIISTVAAVRKARIYPLLIFSQGAILTVWIIVQLMMVTSVHLLHFVMSIIGISLLLIGWTLNKPI